MDMATKYPKHRFIIFTTESNKVVVNNGRGWRVSVNFALNNASGSGGPKTARTEHNIAAVRELVHSQDDQQGHASICSATRFLNGQNEAEGLPSISRTSVRNIISQDLGENSVQRVK